MPRDYPEGRPSEPDFHLKAGRASAGVGGVTRWLPASSNMLDRMVNVDHCGVAFLQPLVALPLMNCDPTGQSYLTARRVEHHRECARTITLHSSLGRGNVVVASASRSSYRTL